MTAKPFSDILGKQLRTSSGKADSRRKMIGIIHGAAKKAGLAEDDRRAMQLEVTGKASLADMTLAELGTVLDRLNQGRPAPMAHRPHVGKIRALWWTAYWLGAVDHPDDAALDAFVERQTGIKRIGFLDHRKAAPVIEALKAVGTRAGVIWTTEATAKVMQAEENGAPVEIAMLDRLAVINAIWRKLREIGAADRQMWQPYVTKVLGLGGNQYRWTPREADDAIKLLGKKLRRALDKRAPE